MIQPALLLIAVILGLAACASALPANKPPSTGLSATAESMLADSVEAMAVNLLETWGRLDPDAYLALFSDDIEFYERGRRMTRADLEGAVRRGTARLREVGWEAEITEGPYVEVLGPDAAAATFVYKAQIGGKTDEVTNMTAAWTLIYERRGERWKVVQAHESFLPAGDS